MRAVDGASRAELSAMRRLRRVAVASRRQLRAAASGSESNAPGVRRQACCACFRLTHSLQCRPRRPLRRAHRRPRPAAPLRLRRRPLPA
jgi:hypothetical protein